jgi:hypothetical protein
MSMKRVHTRTPEKESIGADISGSSSSSTDEKNRSWKAMPTSMDLWKKSLARMRGKTSRPNGFVRSTPVPCNSQFESCRVKWMVSTYRHDISRKEESIPLEECLGKWGTSRPILQTIVLEDNGCCKLFQVKTKLTEASICLSQNNESLLNNLNA